MKTKRYKQVCEKCGSENVKVDAWAVWDNESQRWELGETYDHAHCDDCDGECHVERIETTNEPVMAA
jgi:alpha-D-ribose 1-methylphosphonate 5-phosphate C-P lyase